MTPLILELSGIRPALLSPTCLLRGSEGRITLSTTRVLSSSMLQCLEAIRWWPSNGLDLTSTGSLTQGPSPPVLHLHSWAHSCFLQSLPRMHEVPGFHLTLRSQAQEPLVAVPPGKCGHPSPFAPSLLSPGSCLRPLTLLVWRGFCEQWQVRTLVQGPALSRQPFWMAIH